MSDARRTRGVGAMRKETRRTPRRCAHSKKPAAVVEPTAVAEEGVAVAVVEDPAATAVSDPVFAGVEGGADAAAVGELEEDDEEE